MQAARYAKLDFGVEVDIDMDRFKPHQDGSAKYHFSFGKIRYPNLNQENQGELEGRIVYIKLSRTGNEPAGVEHYRLKNPDFPHQSTADQSIRWESACHYYADCSGESTGSAIVASGRSDCDSARSACDLPNRCSKQGVGANSGCGTASERGDTVQTLTQSADCGPEARN